MTPFSKLLPDGYGGVVLVAVGSTFVNMWMAYNVGMARKKYNVEYPDMYSPTSKEFNCIQRAHQSTLENCPQFLMLLFIGGLQYPRITTAAGVVYQISKIAYAKGYYTGDPANRKWGAFGHFPLLILLGNTISFAVHQLRFCPYRMIMGGRK